MPLHARFDGDIVILSNWGRSMNDPRYVDARLEVQDLLDEGCRKFIVELRGIGETGPPLLGLLMTVTRLIHRHRGEVVLAGLSRSMEHFLDEMYLEDYWDVFQNVREAEAFFRRWEE